MRYVLFHASNRVAIPYDQPTPPSDSGRPWRNESRRAELGGSSDREQKRRERDIKSNKGEQQCSSSACNMGMHEKAQKHVFILDGLTPFSCLFVLLCL